MRSEINTWLTAFISKECELEPEEIVQDLRLEDAGFDSILFVQMAMRLRKEFGIEVNDDDLLLADSVGDLLEAVGRS